MTTAEQLAQLEPVAALIAAEQQAASRTEYHAPDEPDVLAVFYFADGSALAAVADFAPEEEPLRYGGPTLVFPWRPTDLQSAKAYENWVTENSPYFPRAALAELTPLIVALEEAEAAE